MSEVEPTPAAEPKVGESLGSYRIREVRGRGPSGSVLLAQHETLGHRAAILVPSLTRPEHRDRFFDMARKLTRLRHPGLVKIRELAEAEGGRLFMAAEHPVGRALEVVLHKGRPLKLPAAVRLCRDLAAVLQYLHGEGVLLLALEPSSIAIGEDGPAVVGNLFFAVSTDSNLVPADEIASSDSPYVAPELKQPGKPPAGAPADVFSLGAVLRSVLAGTEEPAPPSIVTKAFVETLASRCLTPDPAERPSIVEVRQALDEILSSLDRPPPSP